MDSFAVKSGLLSTTARLMKYCVVFWAQTRLQIFGLLDRIAKKRTKLHNFPFLVKYTNAEKCLQLCAATQQC